MLQLPFAIGQVQDAGLIFLSQIAGQIAEEMIDDPPEHMLATVLVTLSLSTATLGVALMFTGYFKLAGLVQYLPLPVVGGYLAFIGLYCLEAVSAHRPVEARSFFSTAAAHCTLAHRSRLLLPYPPQGISLMPGLHTYRHAHIRACILRVFL